MRTAFITGVTGQLGSYLVELLLSKDYFVVGMARRVSTDNLHRILPCLNSPNFVLEQGDITDCSSLYRILEKHKPDEIYNLCAQSHVGVSFNEPLSTWKITAEGVFNLLEAFRTIIPTARFYQSSSSEMFGDSYSVKRMARLDDDYQWKHRYLQYGGRSDLYDVQAWNWGFSEENFQDEGTRFNPQSPYAIAKLAAHQQCGLYRKAYGLHVNCGILFNSESPRRGDNFVTKKITNWILDYKASQPSYTLNKLKLGNLDASRDWNHAKDSVRAMHLMLQQDEPDDYVISSGVTRSVRDFLSSSFSIAELGNWEDFVEIDTSLFRPAEVPYLRGDATKARVKLGWVPEISFTDLVREMVNG